MNDEYDILKEDTPWPTSNFKRKSPGVGVPGRQWKNIIPSDLKVLIGDILKDSNSLVTTLDVDVNNKTGRIEHVKLVSLNNAMISFDAEHQDNFCEFIKAFQEFNIHKVRISFHNTGWFW